MAGLLRVARSPVRGATTLRRPLEEVSLQGEKQKLLAVEKSVGEESKKAMARCRTF